MSDLLRDVLHMLPNQMVARRVEEDGEAPGVSEGDQMRLPRIVLNVQHGELRDLLSSGRRLVYPVS